MVLAALLLPTTLALGPPTASLRPRFVRALQSPTQLAVSSPAYAFSANTKLVLLMATGVAAMTAAGSIVLLVFASLVQLSVPTRSLVAALILTCASALLEATGYSLHEKFVGRVISEVGQALAIAAAGWSTFSTIWQAGFGVSSLHNRRMGDCEGVDDSEGWAIGIHLNSR